MTSLLIVPAAPYRDFFISRAGAERAFARWVGALIAAQGKSYFLQDEDFRHENFMVAMDAALKSNACVVALLSQGYLDSDYCMVEATTPLKGDPANRLKRLIPLRVEPCVPAGVLANVDSTNLVAERRQADATALALKILRALGFANPSLDGVGPPPEGVLQPPTQIVHPKIRITRSDLAPREDLITRLAAAMRGPGGPIAALTNSNQVVGAVAGMGGVGKTVLAREFARRHSDEYQGVWWIDAEQRGTMLAGLAGLGAEMSAAIKAEANVEHAARATLKLIEDAGYAKPFLIVYDNVEKPGDIELWTPRAGVHVLITTRFTGWDPMVATVDVGMLDREAAIDFLCQRTGRLDDRGEAGLLADELGCLPLALDHAASYCRAPPRPRFKAYRERVLARRLEHKPTQGSQAGQYPYSVRETFNIGLERVIAGDATAGIVACPEAEIVMGVAAVLAPVPIPVSLFAGPRFADADIDAAFRVLGEVSLIAMGEDGRGGAVFTVHRLVQHVMADRLQEAGLTADMVALAIDLLNMATPGEPFKFESWEPCAALLPHAEAVLAWADGLEMRSLLAALLAVRAGQYIQGRQDSRAALPFLQKALAMYEAVAGSDAEATGVAVTSLALAYQGLGRHGEAETMFRRDLAITSKHSGPDAYSTSIVLGHLAGSIQAQGRYAEAEPLLIRSLQIREKTVGAKHPDAASALSALAGLYQAQGRYSEAETLFEQSLTINETVAAEHPNTASALADLASLYQEQRRYADAEPLLRRSLAVSEKTLGPDHPVTASILRAQATLYMNQGCYAEPEALLKRALAISEKAVGPEHPETSAALHILAIFYKDQARFAEAEPLLRRSLAVSERTLGPEHPDSSAALTTLAMLYKDQGRYAEAEPLLERSLANCEASLGAEHPDVGIVLNDFGKLYRDSGRLAEANAAWQRALSITKDAFGAEGDHVGIIEYGLATLDLQTGRYSKALAVLDGVLQRAIETLGENHDEIGRIIRAQAQALLGLGNVDEAESACRRALVLHLRALLADHPEIAQSRWTLARVLIAKGQATEAEPLLLQAIAALEAKVVEGHVWLKGARQTLADLHRPAGSALPAAPAQADVPKRRGWRLFRRSGDST